MTFTEICNLEPRLHALYKDACTIQPHKNRADYYDRWLTYIKQPMVKLVGYGAENPALRNSAAYDLAFRVLKAAFDKVSLPPPKP